MKDFLQINRWVNLLFTAWVGALPLWVPSSHRVAFPICMAVLATSTATLSVLGFLYDHRAYPFQASPRAHRAQHRAVHHLPDHPLANPKGSP